MSSLYLRKRDTCRAYISGKKYPSFDGRFSFFEIQEVYVQVLS